MKRIYIIAIFISFIIASTSAVRFNGVLFTVPDEVLFEGNRYFINYTPLYPFAKYTSLFVDAEVEEIDVAEVGKSLYNTDQNYILGWTLQDSMLYLIGVGFYTEINPDAYKDKFKEIETLTSRKFTDFKLNPRDEKNISNYIKTQKGKSIKASWVNGKFYLKEAKKDKVDIRDWLEKGKLLEIEFKNGVLVSKKELN